MLDEMKRMTAFTAKQRITEEYKGFNIKWAHKILRSVEQGNEVNGLETARAKAIVAFHELGKERADDVSAWLETTNVKAYDANDLLNEYIQWKHLGKGAAYINLVLGVIIKKNPSIMKKVSKLYKADLVQAIENARELRSYCGG